MLRFVSTMINALLRKKFDPIVNTDMRELKEKVYTLESKALEAERRLAEFEAQRYQRQNPVR